MAESIISPGVFQRENDISFIQPAPVEAGAALIGPTVKGPVSEPTTVTSYGEYQRVFGTTFEADNTSQEYLTSIAAKNYFQQGGNTLLVTRVVSGSFTSAESTNIDSSIATGGAAYASASITYVSGSDGDTFLITDGTNTETYIVEEGSVGDLPGLNTYYITGSHASGSGTQAAAAVAKFNEVSSIVTAAVVSGDDITITAAAIGTSGNSIVVTNTDAITTTLAGGENGSTTAPFTLATIGKGALYNSSTSAAGSGAENADKSLVSGSADNLRWEITNVNKTNGTFALSIRRGDDNEKSKVILETFSGLSLDPNSDDYIEARIGNQYSSIQADATYGAYLDVTGEYANRSRYVRVSAVNLPTLNYVGNDGITVGSGANGNYTGSLPIVQSGSFHGGTGTNGNGSFFSSISANTQGLQGTDYTQEIELLRNKDDYQFNVVSAPGLIYSDHSIQLDAIISLAESRGDAIAVVDLAGYGANISDVTANAASINSSYAAAYYPWLKVIASTGKQEWVPASTVIPGVYAFTDNAAAPWFAPAGLVRGGITGVIQAERKLSRGLRDDLYGNKVNPIASFPGQGIAVFGQKTLQTKASALDRINVRRLMIELKDFIGKEARKLVFDQNTITTRNRFLATVNPYLESVVQRQGLYAYRVVMDDTNNTADVVDRNQLVGQIFIQPAKTVEYVVLDFVIEPTGATFTA